MSDEQLHFAISQYVDGTLPPVEAAALERRLQEDPAARRLLEEYRRIGELVQVALPEPEMDWDQFSTRISAAIDRETAPLTDSGDTVPLAYRMWRPLAMAASVLLCATVAMVVLKGPQQGAGDDGRPGAVALNTVRATPGGPVVEPNALVAAQAGNQIQVLIAQKLEGSPLLDVRIGPAPDHKIDLAELYPEMAADYRQSVSIAGDTSRMAMGDEFGMIQ